MSLINRFAVQREFVMTVRFREFNNISEMVLHQQLLMFGLYSLSLTYSTSTSISQFMIPSIH